MSRKNADDIAIEKGSPTRTITNRGRHAACLLPIEIQVKGIGFAVSIWTREAPVCKGVRASSKRLRSENRRRACHTNNRLPARYRTPHCLSEPFQRLKPIYIRITRDNPHQCGDSMTEPILLLLGSSPECAAERIRPSFASSINDCTAFWGSAPFSRRLRRLSVDTCSKCHTPGGGFHCRQGLARVLDSFVKQSLFDKTTRNAVERTKHLPYAGRFALPLRICAAFVGSPAHLR